MTKDTGPEAFGTMEDHSAYTGSLPENNTTDQVQEGVSLFVTSSEFLRSIKDELEYLIATETAAGVLFRVGYRCGHSAASKLAHTDDRSYDLKSILNRLWTNIGLTPLQITSLEDDRVCIISTSGFSAIPLSEIEDLSGDFIRGYMAGLVSEALGKEFIYVNCHVENEDDPAGNDIRQYDLYTQPNV